MTEWMTHLDDIGPEKIVHVYDPETNLRGVVVVDCTALGETVGGGIRMMPDVTTAEVAGLARAMTYKFNAIDLPVGGAKSGIWGSPSVSGEERRNLMLAFGRAIKPLMQSGLNIGADIGTDADDLAVIHEGAGMPWNTTGLVMQEKDGEPLENHATGYGVVAAARAACEFAGVTVNGATAAIEGFGKVGGGVCRYFNDLGVKVVALSTIDGAIYNPDGLDVAKLLADRKTKGDKAVSDYADAQHIEAAKLFHLPVDILVPGARPHVITEASVGGVQAKVISSIANNPITDKAEAMLFGRGIHVVPDFMANAGGITVALVDILGGDAVTLFRVLDDVIGDMSTEILNAARKANVNPRALAQQRTLEQIKQARITKVTVGLEELIERTRKRFKM